MKTLLIFVFGSLTMVVGCAQQPPTAQPASAAPPASPAVQAAAEEAPGRSAPAEAEGATCESPECSDACKNAGDRLSACAEAFAAGCFSDRKPEGDVCSWNAPAKEMRMADEVSEDAAPSRSRKKVDSTGVEARTEVTAD